MAFIWIALVYVIIAFADITAGSFVSSVDEIKGIKVNFNPGGAVASASIFYLLLALVMGVTKRLLNPPLWLLTAIFVTSVSRQRKGAERLAASREAMRLAEQALFADRGKTRVAP